MRLPKRLARECSGAEKLRAPEMIHGKRSGQVETRHLSGLQSRLLAAPNNCEIDRKAIETVGEVLASSDRQFVVTSGTGLARSKTGGRR
jgi:hypothetical protein